MAPRLRILASLMVITPWLAAAVAADCPSGDLFVNHDDTFESAYCWYGNDMQEPYFGAWGEGYDLGPGTVVCGAYWITWDGISEAVPVDLYVWDGGVSSEPGEVLALSPGAYWYNWQWWPGVGENVYELGVGVSAEFTVGCWIDWSWEGYCGDFLAVDVDGPGGCPWTCVAPGLEWPSGWQDPSIVFGPTASLGIGVYFEPRDPATVDDLPEGEENAESSTWGRIRILFR